MHPTDEKWVLGFDVGGTKTECLLARYSTKVQKNALPCGFLGAGSLLTVARERVPTLRHLGYQNIISQVVTLGRSLLETHGVHISELAGVGFGLPGAVDPKSKMMVNGNTLVLKDKPFAYEVTQGLGVDPALAVAANDANCFALAETLCGQGPQVAEKIGVPPGEQTVVGLILGTGCGGGLVHQGRIVTGARGAALEVGHMILFPQGLPCYCGQLGCVEQYVSGSALESAFGARRTGAHTSLKEWDGAQIFCLAQEGDPTAQAVVAQTRRHLGSLLTQLTNLFDPHYFVLGGGLSLQKDLVEGLDKMLTYQCFVNNGLPQILTHSLGDSAGVVGAALLALQACFESQSTPLTKT